MRQGEHMNELKKYLGIVGLNMLQASRKSGIPFSTIQGHCAGTRRISAELAVKYEDTLGIPKEALRPDLWQ